MQKIEKRKTFGFNKSKHKRETATFTFQKELLWIQNTELLFKTFYGRFFFTIVAMRITYASFIPFSP